HQVLDRGLEGARKAARTAYRRLEMTGGTEITSAAAAARLIRNPEVDHLPRSWSDSMTTDLLAALRRAGLREVDPSRRRGAEYSTDASLYRVVPSAVAFPRSTDDVLAAVDVCRELSVPLTARGAGTSIAGNAVGTGLVLDFSRHLNAVRSIDAEA